MQACVCNDRESAQRCFDTKLKLFAVLLADLSPEEACDSTSPTSTIGSFLSRSKPLIYSLMRDGSVIFTDPRPIFFWRGPTPRISPGVRVLPILRLLPRCAKQGSHRAFSAAPLPGLIDGRAWSAFETPSITLGTSRWLPPARKRGRPASRCDSKATSSK